MNTWLLSGFYLIAFVLVATGVFFFVATRGTLVLRSLNGNTDATAHIYPLYSDMRLIKLVDFQPIISAILLFQYHRLVSSVIAGLQAMDLTNKKVLITSCAFGNVIPRVTQAAVDAGARRVLIADIICNELIHARDKLGPLSAKADFIEDDATSMQLGDGAVDANVIFFLLHELPHDLKHKALSEAGRVLKPGGKLFLAEFHRPRVWVLRALSWTYFKVFEPLGLALWDTHDPVEYLQSLPGWTCTRTTVFFGNFQIVTATKPGV